MAKSALPNVYIQGEFFALDAFVADVKKLQSPPNPIPSIISIICKNLAIMMWNTFMTRGYGTWVMSRSERMCPQTFGTLRGRRDVIPTALRQALEEMAMNPTGNVQRREVWGIDLMIGGTKIIERTVRCPSSRKIIYRQGREIVVPMRAPTFGPAGPAQMASEIETWLIDHYFQRGRKYHGMVHGMRYKPFSGERTGREMTGYTPTEVRAMSK